MEASCDPGLLLKVTPPRLRRSLLIRGRLRHLAAAGDDVPITVLEAPAGYGKTSLIAQWRLDWLQSGLAVGWLSLDAADRWVTLVSGIALGLRRSIGRSHFAAEAVDTARRGAGSPAALTALLAEITDLGRPMALVFDNGERLVDPESADVVGYLLHNLPPNLRVVIGTRPPARVQVLDLLGHGLLRRVDAPALAFDLPETISLLAARFGHRVDADLCGRLHELTGGWPLGLELAASSLERSPDPQRSVERFASIRDDGLHELLQGLLESLPEGAAEFLVRCALLDALHPSLCAAVTRVGDPAPLLQRLLTETPLLTATEEGEWLRLHPLAREYLRAEAGRSLTEADRHQVHVAAWHWYAARGFPERSAQHALAAGYRDEALQLVSAFLSDEYDQGHHGQVSEWLARIPPRVLEGNPRLRMVELWMDVLDHRFDDAVRQATSIMDAAASDRELYGEALAALAAAYAVADRQDEAARYVAASESMVTNSRARHAVAVLKADAACNSGDTELARRVLADMEEAGMTPAVQIWRDYLTQWSHLLDGHPVLAEHTGRIRHAWWAAQVGRRGLRAATLGSLLAAACWQQDARGEARALLANRVDVIEQAAGYAGLIHAYLTLARIALADGDELRWSTCLESLSAIGTRRGTVRPVAASLAERVRVHAARGRPAQAESDLAELTRLLLPARMSGVLAAQLYLELELARAHVAIAHGNPGIATEPLGRARELASRLRRGYESIQVLALQALIAEQQGGRPEPLLFEALSRAESGGLVRVFADTLPELVELVRRHAAHWPTGAAGTEFIRRVLASTAPEVREPVPSLPARGAMLTPKECQVLQLLAGGLHNKQIAVELELSNDTVKWHVKKLFAKLDAGSREHAVARARMLGLLR